MSLKAKIEAIIYATEEPVTLNELVALLKDSVLAEIRADSQTGSASDEDSSSKEQPTGPPVGEEPTVTAPTAVSSVGDPSAEAAASEMALSTTETQTQSKTPAKKQSEDKEQLKAARTRVSAIIDELTAEYASADRGMEIRQVAGGYRMTTKPEHHDVVVSFAKSLKPPVRLSLQALETLSVIAYKQPVTVPEISEIRGVDTSGVIATLLDRKLITTAGRKQVIGRPILYKTTKEFLLRFGLNDISELPSMEEFEKLGEPQAELFSAPAGQPASAAAENENEPVTEAVPETAPHHLVGEQNVTAEGVFETEAVPENSGEKS